MNKSPLQLSMMMIMIISTLMAMSSSNWLMMWLSLEINLMSFLPIILNTSKYQETEAAIKYFMAQAIGSSLLLMSSMLMWSHNSLYSSMTMIITFALIMKMGAFPCHFWYTSVMSSISWMSALILSTWQKLAPLIIMSYMLINSKQIMVPLAIMNALTGGILGINQSQLRTIMAYSSVTHMGWMIMLLSMNNSYYTIVYFFLYTLLIIPIFMMFNSFNTINITQLNKINLSFKSTLLLSIMLLSLGGMPPLIGFFPKLMTMYLLPTSTWIPLMLLVMGSLCNLYFYLNIMFSVLMSQKTSYSTMKPKMEFMYLSMFLSISILWIPLITM